MQGFMYIAGSFQTVRRSKCGGGRGWIDNDPHFWTSPPTWGICRNDLRRKVGDGDYIFFVLPRNAQHPQCLFGYMRVAEKISHSEAFIRRALRSKRMGNKNPNGNIIVDASGNYNRFDGGEHWRIFDKVKQEYVIGNPKNSRFLNEIEIARLAPRFLDLLKDLFGGRGSTPYDCISRYGRQLSEPEIHAILKWVDT